MNTHDDLERMLGEQLTRQASGVHGTPLGLADVQGRAGRIQRNRRLAAGAGVAAALAVIVPVAITAGGVLDAKQDVDPANPTPTPTPAQVARTTLTLDGLSRGDDPGVEYFTPDGVVLPGRGLQPLEESLQALVPSSADGGWLALGPARDELRYLQEDFSPNGADPASGLVTTADRTRFATVMTVGGEQTLFVRSTSDRSDGQAWDFPAFPSVEVVDFVGDDTVLYQTMADGEVTEIGLALDGADGSGTTTPLTGTVVKAIAADDTTGLVSIQTRSKKDASGCFAVLDSRADLKTPIWETCDYSLGEFSPDGRYVMASSPYGDGFGLTEIEVLDARTGALVAEFTQTGRSQIALVQPVWESADTIVAVAAEGETQTIVRLGVDGTLEESVEPVEGTYGDLYFYLGADRTAL